MAALLLAVFDGFSPVEETFLCCVALHSGIPCLEAAQSEKPKDTETPQSYRNT